MGSKTEIIEIIKKISDEEANEILVMLKKSKDIKKAKNIVVNEFSQAMKESFGIWKDRNISDGALFQKEMRAKWRRQ